jgi:hypothetical protein
MKRGVVHPFAASIVFAAMALAPMATLGAQRVRVTGTTVSYYFELQPVLEDSIADSLTIGAGLVRQSAVGAVSCPEGHTQCYFYRSGDKTHTVPLTQDVEAIGWGLGEGVSVYAHVRARAHLAGEIELWTRENDHLTTLAAYAEIARERWTARAGRQWLNSQLGVNNFDGASLVVRPRDGLSIQGYAGRGLVQGLSESFTNVAIGAVDLLPPDVGAILLGATARYRTSQGIAYGAEYQREMRSDRAGLYSERVAFDAAGASGGTSFIADAQVDLATTAINEFRVRASRLVTHGASAGLEYLHSTPFFPLWTIWGVFSPVGFNEVRADGIWTSDDNGYSFAASGGYRQYQDTHTGVGFLPIRNDGWTTVFSGAWRLKPAWEMTASYRRDIGFGASKSDGTAGVRWQRDDGARWLAFTGSAVQNIFEFRVANGYVAGVTIDGGIPLTSELRLSGQVGLYRQMAGETPSTTVNWSQRLATLRLQWAPGRDPGIKP